MWSQDRECLLGQLTIEIPLHAHYLTYPICSCITVNFDGWIQTGFFLQVNRFISSSNIIFFCAGYASLSLRFLQVKRFLQLFPQGTI